MLLLFISAIMNIVIVVLIFFFLRWLLKKSKGQSQNKTDTPMEYRQSTPKAKPATQTQKASVQSTAAQKTKKDTLDLSTDREKRTAEIEPATQEEIKGMDFIKDVESLPDGPKKTSYMMAFAEAGDSAAQYLLGEAYIFENGGLKRNFKKAKRLLEKSANQGNANAMADLGFLCMELIGDVFEEADQKGETQEEYMPKAMELMDEAALNFAKSLANYGTPGFKLAERIYNGNMKMDWNQGNMRELLLEKINTKLQPLIEELKAKDDGYSNYVLGNLAVRGIGLQKDFIQAKAYFEHGAELGNWESKFELENPLFILDDDDE